MAGTWTGARAKESAAGAAIPILSRPLTYINTSELLAWVVTDATSSDEDQRYVRNESYSGFNSEGFRRSPADPKKKPKTSYCGDRSFHLRTLHCGCQSFRQPTSRQTKDPVPLIRREPQCRTSR